MVMNSTTRAYFTSTDRTGRKLLLIYIIISLYLDASVDPDIGHLQRVSYPRNPWHLSSRICIYRIIIRPCIL